MGVMDGGPERRSTLVDVAGLAVYVDLAGRAGNRPPLVLLHGGMATNATWRDQIEGLSVDRLVVAPERRAHGHTPDRPGPITYEDMARETVGTLVALGLGPVDLLGWSDGGMVGLLVAGERPDLVRTLAVTGTGFSSAGYVPGSIDALVDAPDDDDDVVMFAALYAEASPDGPEHFPEVWDKVRAMWREPFDWEGLLPGVVAPTLVMVGDDDYITVAHAERFALGVARGQLAVFPGSSHLVPMERPALFNAMVAAFLDDPEPDTLMPLRRAAGGS